MSLSPQIQLIFDAIMKAYPDGLTLDQLSEELLAKPVSFSDIEEIIGALEDASVDLEGPEQPPRAEDLARVLTVARSLAAETGRRPSAADIAARAGLTPAAVLRALQFGRSVAR